MAKPTKPLIALDESAKSVWRGLQLTMRDARAFRATEPRPSRGAIKRIRPSSKPIRALLDRIRANYDGYGEWLRDPERRSVRRKGRTTDVHESATFPELKSQRVSGDGLVAWRLIAEQQQWSTKRIRDHVLLVGVALRALDDLDELLDDLDRRLARRYTSAELEAGKNEEDGYMPVEMLDAVMTALTTIAPLVSDPAHDEIRIALTTAARQSRRIAERWKR